MSWLPRTAPGATPLDRTFGLRPDAYARFRELYGTLWDGDAIDLGIVELCRLRIATLLGCEAELAVRYTDGGLDEPKVAALPSYPTASTFTDAERAALAYAEQYVLDPHLLDDAHFVALHAQLDERAIATLTLAVAMFDALIRFRLALGVEPVGPAPTVVEGPGRAPAHLP